MRFGLDIKCDNAAFEDGPEREVCRILLDLANRVMRGQESGIIFDLNGNSVGQFDFTRTPREEAEDEG